MANPQTEDGYTRIANEIMDALIAADISGQDFKVALLIIRKTYGYNKCEDAVSLSQMANATGMGRIRCSQVVNRLQLMKILTVTENINGIGKKYKFNKDFEKWGTVKENINRIEKTKLTVKENINHKRQYTKDNKPPLPPKVKKTELPDWVPMEIFLRYQASRSKKLKPESFEYFFRKLKKLAEVSRASPEAILVQSIENGWQGIFELKQGGNNGNGNRRTYPNTYRRGTERDTELPPDVQRTIDEINRRSREQAAAKAEADATNGRDRAVDPGA
jgi:phage replication O-like protein O